MSETRGIPSGLEGFEDDEAPLSREEQRNNLAAAWKENRGFRMMIIVMGIALVTVLIFFFTGSKKKVDPSSLVTSGQTGAPETTANPEVINAVRREDARKAKEAEEQGSSAIPRPIAKSEDLQPTIEGGADPLAEFQRQPEPPPPLELPPQQIPPPAPAPPQVDTEKAQKEAERRQALAMAMAQSMGDLSSDWRKSRIQIHTAPTSKDDPNNLVSQQSPLSPSNQPLTPLEQERGEVLQRGGTMAYGQLLIEANSDTPTPVVAEILTGRLKGARLIGSFQVAQDKLVIQFSRAIMPEDDTEYDIEALALDPSTTLPGLVTEYDGRYFRRIIIPAAAAFVEGFGKAIADSGKSTIVSDGAVVTSQDKLSTEEQLTVGAAEAASRAGQILSQDAGQVRPMVAVGAGTGIGILFTKTVRDEPQ